MSKWRPAVLSAILLLAPIAFTVSVAISADQGGGCLGLNCRVPAPSIGPFPANTVAWALGIVWLVVASLGTRYVWLVDRVRLRRAIVIVTSVSIAASVLVVACEIIFGSRFPTIAVEAGIGALLALLAAIPIVLAWAVLTASKEDQGPANRQTVTPSWS
jgi:uncharacterized BrkB/YihY/UPF0761 family membrane protein